MFDATHRAPRPPAPRPPEPDRATPVWASVVAVTVLAAVYWLAGATAAVVLDAGEVIPVANAVTVVHLIATLSRHDLAAIDDLGLRDAIRLNRDSQP
jgi:hypothetical protein